MARTLCYVSPSASDGSVGVGTADYRSMETLDGDDVRLVNRAGKRASRDIVQFVPMRDFKGKSSHALAKEVRHFC